MKNAEFVPPYDETTSDRMKQLAGRLTETDRRAYAAVEAYRLGQGGVTYIAKLFGMSPETIKRGREDLDLPNRLPPSGRQRAVGAGRKGVFSEQPGLEAAFDDLVKTHIAGDPMNADVVWTDLQPSEMVDKLADKGYFITENTVRAALKKRNFGNANRAK